MKSIVDKTSTLRTAVATSSIIASEEAIQKLQSNDVPKKDILIVARVAAVQAAKNTPQIIPYCHPIPIDSVDVDFEVGKERIMVMVKVQTIWKTGVEMEALAGATAATLTIYDMLKPIDKGMEIVSTKLLEKKGGKSNRKEWLPKNFKAAVLVTSDGTSHGIRQDKSGLLIKERLKAYGIEPAYLILPDECDKIHAELEEFCRKDFHLVLTTGGTGLGPRDVTVEATEKLGGREIPGIMEAARNYGQNRTPYAMLSRGLAVQFKNSIIINLPSSSKGVEESLNAIFPHILHLYPMMQGAGH